MIMIGSPREAHKMSGKWQSCAMSIIHWATFLLSFTLINNWLIWKSSILWAKWETTDKRNDWKRRLASGIRRIWALSSYDCILRMKTFYKHKSKYFIVLLRIIFLLYSVFSYNNQRLFEFEFTRTHLLLFV